MTEDQEKILALLEALEVQDIKRFMDNAEVGAYRALGIKITEAYRDRIQDAKAFIPPMYFQATPPDILKEKARNCWNTLPLRKFGEVRALMHACGLDVSGMADDNTEAI